MSKHTLIVRVGTPPIRPHVKFIGVPREELIDDEIELSDPVDEDGPRSYSTPYQQEHHHD